MTATELSAARAALTKAEATKASLESQKEQKEKRRDALASERKGLAYAAATEDKNAAAKLAKLNTETTGLAIEIENLANAIAEAEARIAVAKQVLAQAEQRRKAKEAAARLAKFEEFGKSLDDHAAALVEALNAFASEAHVIRQLGMGAPSHDLLMANMRRAWLTAFGTDRLGEGFGVGIMQPSQRISFAALVAEWAGRIDATAQAAIAAE